MASECRSPLCSIATTSSSCACRRCVSIDWRFGSSFTAASLSCRPGIPGRSNGSSPVGGRGTRMGADHPGQRASARASVAHVGPSSRIARLLPGGLSIDNPPRSAGARRCSWHPANRTWRQRPNCAGHNVGIGRAPNDRHPSSTDPPPPAGRIGTSRPRAPARPGLEVRAPSGRQRRLRGTAAIRRLPARVPASTGPGGGCTGREPRTVS